MISGTLKSRTSSTPIANGRLRGDRVSFTAAGAQYTGRVNGNVMEGTVKPAGGNWKATRAGN